MKRIFLISFSLFLISNSLFAQVEGGGPDYQKLFDMFVLEKYEDCLFKATSMSEKDKYMKKPEPWLYMSMCLLKISEMTDEEIIEKYPKALPDAIKYAAKFRKKDKTGELYEQNKEFFEKIKVKGCTQAHWYLADGNYRKAASEYKKVYKVDKQDYALQYMVAVCYFYAKNLGEAKLNLKISRDSLASKFTNPDYKVARSTTPVLVEAYILYSDFLVDAGMADSAKAVIRTALSYLPEEKDLKTQASKLGI